MMMLNNRKVAEMLGFNLPQMYKLMSLGILNLGIVKKNKVYNQYYILRSDLEKFLGRELTEEEWKRVRK